MPGFFISNQNVSLRYQYETSTAKITESMNVKKPGTIIRHTLAKFMQDKAFVDTDDYIVILDGYLLNKKELLSQYGVDTVEKLLPEMYRRDGDEFFNNFRGGWSGALYVKNKRQWFIFTNHVGDKAIFWGESGDKFFVGSELDWVMQGMRQNKAQVTFNEDAAYQMLTFGFMEGNDTYAKEINRLRGGTYLLIDDNGLRVEEYHCFTKHPDRFAGKSETEIIEALDASFREAVRQEYDKDEEYGYLHLADMSGGLDSRMSAWVAHTLKPRHLQLCTYCKANYLDELIAKEIAYYWKDELFVKPLDDMRFIYDVDETVYQNSGVSLYSGGTGCKRFLESLNMDRYGLEHSGQVGDAIVGSFFNARTYQKQEIVTGKHSERFVHRLKNKKADLGYADHEIYLLYVRGMNGALGTHLFRQHYTEVASGFLHTDFFQLCLDIPSQLRVGHYLYEKWILTKYPKAADFRWEKTRGRINDGRIRRFARKLVTRGPQKLYRIVTGKQLVSSDNMNPLDYWYERDSGVREFFQSYYSEAMQNLVGMGISKRLVDDMEMLFSTGTITEKTMVLTVLAAIKIWFGQVE